MNHRCGKLDMLLGKRLRIHFVDGQFISGQLIWDTEEQSYKLRNCMDVKTGVFAKDKLFRKSNVLNIERV